MMRGCRTLTITLLCFLLAGCKTGESLYRISLAPMPPTEGELLAESGTVTFEKEGVWGALWPLSHEELGRPSSINREWTFPDPFDGLYDEYAMPVVFYLVLENRSDRAFAFNPSTSFSLIDASVPLFSIEYDDFYERLYDQPRGDQRLTNIRRMLFRSYQTLQPGDQTRGLLLFKRPREEAGIRPMLLFIRRIFMGEREIEFLIPFEMQTDEVPAPPARSGNAPGTS